MLSQILGMFIYRPYVFVFFAIYIVAATRKHGLRQTLVYTLVAYAVAFACEFSSTRIGLPFGLYHYLDATRERELWIFNVPFWDSLSFTFLCYLGWRLGVFLYAPLLVERGDIQVVETRELRRSRRVLVAGALLVTLLDVVIDPVTVRGEKWFLGRIYFYPEGGVYFGVPISNFIGWFFVAAITIWCYQRLDGRRWMDPSRYPGGIGWIRWGGLVEPALYFGIFIFNVAVTVFIGEAALALVDVAIFLPVALLLVGRLVDPRARASKLELASHAGDFVVSWVWPRTPRG